MKRILKSIIIFVFIIILFTINTFAITTNEEDIEKYRDSDLACRIINGFYGDVNDDYRDFVSDINEVITEISRGNVTYVNKKMNSKTLLVGHSIVAFCGDSIRDEHIDVIGLTGGRFMYVEKLFEVMPINKYKKVVVWIGINDVLFSLLENKNGDEIYDDIIKGFDSLNEKFVNNNIKPYFISISPTSDDNLNTVIHRINEYLNSKYNLIDAKYFPDLNQHHFYTTTFRKIYDEQIKPVISEE